MSTGKTDAARVTGIDVHAYMTEDTPRALAFYKALLGAEPARTYPEDAGGEFDFDDGATFGIWNPQGTFPFRPASGVMFAVADIEQARENAVRAGAQMMQVSETPVCWMAGGMDPDGNAFILHKRKQHD